MHTIPYLARWTALAIVLVSCIGCDQLTKQLAIAQLKGQPARTYWGGAVRLEYAENPGAFLGLGGQLPPAARWAAMVVCNGIVTAVIFMLLVARRQVSPAGFAAAALLLAGALGNLIDRVRCDGLVIDFMNLGLGPLRTGIFNVADVAITAGAVCLAVTSFAAQEATPVQ
jgi:signal peptidase II